MAKINLHPNLDREVKKGVAWAVHAFTTCGIVLGFLALVSVLKNDPVAAFMWLGLALLERGRERHGEVVKIFDGVRNIHMYGVICDPMHYDRENKKLHA